MRLLPILLLFLVGCVAPSSQKIEEHKLVGRYENGDGFWPRWLELKPDGTFSYMQLTDVINEKGEFEGSWGFDGNWKFISPDRLELSARGRPEKIVVFVRPSRKHGYAILEPDLFSDILSTWSDDDGLRYLKKETGKEPNRVAGGN
jgi:hypothetical protein